MAEEDGHYLLRLIGDVRVTQCMDISQYLQGIFKSKDIKSLTVDLSGAKWLDSTTLGLLTRLAQLVISKGCCKPIIVTQNDDIIELLRSMYMQLVYDFSRDDDNCVELLVDSCTNFNGGDSRSTVLDKDEIKREVINAHRALMELSTENTKKFTDLLKALEV